MPHCKPSHGTQYTVHYTVYTNTIHNICRLEDTRRLIHRKSIHASFWVLTPNFFADSLYLYECMHRNEVVCVSIYIDHARSHTIKASVQCNFVEWKQYNGSWCFRFVWTHRTLSVNTISMCNMNVARVACIVTTTTTTACILCSLYYAISQFGIVFVYTTITH